MSEIGFGTGILTGLRTDTAGPNTPIRFGLMQGVEIMFEGDQKTLYSLNQFPNDSARGKTKVSGKAKVAEIRGRMYNDLFFGQTLTTGQQKFAYNESTTLGTGAASYTVANAASQPITDQGVFYNNTTGSQLTVVASSPVSSQYTFVASTGVYTFSTFDATAAIVVNYLYTVTTGQTLLIGNPLMGTTPRFTATLMQQYEAYQMILQLNQCTATRLSYPTHIDDYSIQDLDFEAYADGAGTVGHWYTGT
jgi:hypothetical protein